MVRDISIPVQISLGGSMWSVGFDNKLCEDLRVYGRCGPSQTRIVLGNTAEGQLISEEKLQSVYMHELVHAILHTIGEDELYTNEKFIDMFSQTLCQALRTAVYPAQINDNELSEATD